MKKLFLMVSTVLTTQTVTATNSKAALQDTLQTNQTKVVMVRPDSVIMENHGNEFRVTVAGTEGNPQFRYSRQMTVNANEPVVERQREWDFKIPFSGKSKDKHKSHHSFKMSGVAMGFSRPLDAPTDMQTTWGASFEIVLPGLLGYCHHINNHFDVSAGFGLGWRNFRMTGHTRFLKEGDHLVMGTYPEGAEIQFSRLRFFSLMIPLTATCHLGHGFEFSLGPVVNFNTFANVKTRYKLDGKKVKEKQGNIHQRPVTADIMAVLSYKSIGFYTKYSPCKLLDGDFSPEFSALSMGVTLFY